MRFQKKIRTKSLGEGYINVFINGVAWWIAKLEKFSPPHFHVQTCWRAALLKLENYKLMDRSALKEFHADLIHNRWSQISIHWTRKTASKVIYVRRNHKSQFQFLMPNIPGLLCRDGIWALPYGRISVASVVSLVCLSLAVHQISESERVSLLRIRCRDLIGKWISSIWQPKLG